jgi:hypothetical protein
MDKPALHLLQVEFLHTRLIGGDGGALHADRVLQNGLGGILGDLVIGLVTVLQSLKQQHDKYQCTVER